MPSGIVRVGTESKCGITNKYSKYYTSILLPQLAPNNTYERALSQMLYAHEQHLLCPIPAPEPALTRINLHYVCLSTHFIAAHDTISHFSWQLMLQFHAHREMYTLIEMQAPQRWQNQADVSGEI